jgi:hypothetical protein
MTEGTRKTNFLAVLALLVVMGYTMAAPYVMATKGVSFNDFSAAVGPMGGMLLG